ncbi:hypothetical protein N7456_008523 [Penicillium angulare]|uniref:Uncharacterized protein n=1 Tax=Penicillium angulare TaxID=116970 RepID=A0A9W9EFU9_9EURO|nr:hypothetical protein N7456_013295 [Penicillium angulare]KAJ5097802.1 hypothetical protein N7456_008523 [Penicillium angulare]
MSTIEEALASRNRVSEYHVYHEGMDHVAITPFLDPTKEWGYNRRRRNSQIEDRTYHQRECGDSNSYFLHKPSLLFRDPPRTLRRGNCKNGTPLCLINNKAFWREWSIQFSSNLEDILDPRGIVKWEHRSKPNNETGKNDYALKGHKVRTWRVWGESGGEYHRRVNARRKAVREEGIEKTPAHEPAFADESVKLKWTSPMRNARRYHFEYAGIRFWWEGTRDFHAMDNISAKLMPLNHLKLIAQPTHGEKMLVAHYVSDFSSKKFGKLLVFDSAVTRLLEDTCENGFATRQAVAHKLGETPQESDLKATRIHELIMATAMCMIVGEWEKRMAIWSIMMLIVTIGNGMNIANI